MDTGTVTQDKRMQLTPKLVAQLLEGMYPQHSPEEKEIIIQKVYANMYDFMRDILFTEQNENELVDSVADILEEADEKNVVQQLFERQMNKIPADEQEKITQRALEKMIALCIDYGKQVIHEVVV